MRRRDFVTGVGAGLAAGAPANSQACTFNGDSDAFKYFSSWHGCSVTFRGRVPQVFTSGAGPSVIVLHEITGAEPALFAFAHRLVLEGFTVFVPILFGTPNHRASLGYTAEQATRICITKEFNCFNGRQSSPIVDWVRQLGASVFASAQTHDPSARGIGVIGLCLTGNFALAMAADEHLLAPVVSEPALPFATLLKPENRASLGLTESELSALKRRLASGMQLAVFRFKDDPIVPLARMTALKELVESSHGTMVGDFNLCPPCPNAHAVFTGHFDPSSSVSQTAFQTLVHFLHERLTT